MLHATAHVFTAALRRLNLAVTIRTLGDVDRLAAVELQRVVDQLFVARAARHRANAHAALGTAIDRHGHSPLEVIAIRRSVIAQPCRDACDSEQTQTDGSYHRAWTVWETSMAG